MLILPFSSFAQKGNKQLVDSLKYVTYMPYIGEAPDGNGDRIFWKVVQQKRAIIPTLIGLLTDTTSAPAHVPNFGGRYTVADIAYDAIGEIIHGIPTFGLLGVKFDDDGCGYCAYWNHVRSDIKNRKHFQAKVKAWYKVNKKNLVWISSDEYNGCDCAGPHPNGGHFTLKKGN